MARVLPCPSFHLFFSLSVCMCVYIFSSLCGLSCVKTLYASCILLLLLLLFYSPADSVLYKRQRIRCIRVLAFHSHFREFQESRDLSSPVLRLQECSDNARRGRLADFSSEIVPSPLAPFRLHFFTDQCASALSNVARSVLHSTVHFLNLICTNSMNRRHF